jgi:hypothetical protein
VTPDIFGKVRELKDAEFSSTLAANCLSLFVHAIGLLCRIQQHDRRVRRVRSE